MVNRGAVILRYKTPFVKWIQEADPSGQKLELTIEQANKEKTVYLISDEDAENFERWVSENFETLFDSELGGWYGDESLWPQKRDYKTFNEWLEVECHSVVIDTVGGEIFDDDI